MDDNTSQLEWSDQTETEEFGERLGLLLRPGDLVAVSGDLGAGKSVLARAAIRGRAGNPALEVPSPTFTLVQTYDMPDGLLIWHVDLYRLCNPDECAELGLDDALTDAALIVEWPDRLEHSLKTNNHLSIDLFGDDTESMRKVILSAGSGWETRFESLTTVR